MVNWLNFDSSNPAKIPQAGKRVSFTYGSGGYPPESECICHHGERGADGTWTAYADDGSVRRIFSDSDVWRWKYPRTPEEAEAYEDRHYKCESTILRRIAGTLTRAELAAKLGAEDGDLVWFWKQREELEHK